MEMLLAIRGLRIFGHFDDTSFAELYKHIESVKLETDQSLFATGEPDDSVYVVQDGQVSFTVQEYDSACTIALVITHNAPTLIQRCAYSCRSPTAKSPFS